MSGNGASPDVDIKVEPLEKLNEAQLIANAYNCNTAAIKSFKAQHPVAAAGYEIAAALYHCTLHLADTLSMVLVQTCDRED